MVCFTSKRVSSNFYDECIWKIISPEMRLDQLRSMMRVPLQLNPRIAEFMRDLLPDAVLQQMYGTVKLCN